MQGADLFFGNVDDDLEHTFGHREQVVGEIEGKKEKEDIWDEGDK